MSIDRHSTRAPHAPRHDGTTPPPAAAATGAPGDGESASILLEKMGGVPGFVHSTVPVIVFITANAFLPLPLAIGIALASGLALFGFRLLRGERFATAVGSLLGVAVAAALVALTGSARDFFAIGIWLSLAGFVVTLGSVLACRPLTGVVWNLVHGGEYDWRANGSVRRGHDLATLAAALVLGARFAVQQWLYIADSTTGLGIARVAMGTPLTILAALVVVWAFRRSTKRLVRTGR
jgi:hypothetical protein